MAQLVDHTQPPEDWGEYIPEDEEYYVTACSKGFDAYVLHAQPPGPPCYPVTVGEVIQGGSKSYRIEHKLGYGAFSMIRIAI
jgi:hypothetical protein